jgi:hypothetical protein
MTLITDHAWRGFNSVTLPRGAEKEDCAYLNCRRPRSEHAAAVRGTKGGRPGR